MKKAPPSAPAPRPSDDELLDAIGKLTTRQVVELARKLREKR